MNDQSALLLDKADRAIRFARQAHESFGPEFAAGRIYYAMFYAASAALEHHGMRRRKHSGVHAAFNELLVKPGTLDASYYQWLIEAFNARTTDDYGTQAAFDDEATRIMVGRAEQFIRAVRTALSNG